MLRLSCVYVSKASHCESGDHEGAESYAGVLVIWVIFPLFRSITYRSQNPDRSEANASWVRSGLRAGAMSFHLPVVMRVSGRSSGFSLWMKRCAYPFSSMERKIKLFSSLYLMIAGGVFVELGVLSATTGTRVALVD